MRNVAIFLFDEVEVLDFAGPYEIFSITGLRTEGPKPFNVYTVGEKQVISARNGLKIITDFLLQDCPSPDIIIIPGGGGYHPNGTSFGSRREMDNPTLLHWIIEKEKTAELVLSVCTGSLILAKTGLLEGLSATTHFLAIDSMKDISNNIMMYPEKRWVDNGKIILSAGVSAGIDMSLYVVGKLLGKEVAAETATYAQYDHWKI